jgi:CheY-like chemotaxis protein
VSLEAADILLVDDSASDVEVATRAFRQNALERRVKVLSDGAELIEYLLGPGGGEALGPVPKAILLDLKMPRLDGRGVLRALRAHPRTRHVPVVVVSWSHQDDDIRDCYALGANSFVVKRFESTRPGQYLVDAARYWLETNESSP